MGSAPIIDPVGLRISSITTRLDGDKTNPSSGTVSKKEFDYETFVHNYPSLTGGAPVGFLTSRGNVSEIREFDYGSGAPGSLVRRTTRTYLHNATPSYQTYNIVNKVLTESLLDAAGVQKARTEYVYDSTALTAATGSPQHDDVGYSTTFTTRGNATAVKRWRNTDSALLTTSYSYDTLGNILSISDPLSHTTNYSYTDSWANGSCAPPSNSRAYVTQIMNHLSQRVQLSYYPCTSLTSARKDENDILNSRAGTTYSFDLLGRPTVTNFPDGGQTTQSYVDTVPFKATTTTKLTATANRVSDVEFDGLGRSRKTRLTSDPQGTVYTRTVYDGLGRAFQTWNPTRCDPDIGSCSELTYGITETQYDALGRVTKVIPPDGTAASNNITTAYSANATTVTDQAGKLRRSLTDGLGRLIRVDEPNTSNALGTVTSPNQPTSYGYDVMDNLTGVTQGSQTRTFVYNSLSQLTSATNPESGTVQYGYTNDGNLLTRTDARGTVTTHGYDGIHRLTTKTYTIAGTTAATPNVTYTYDSLANACNSKGRLTSVSSTASTSNILCYDSLGRVTQSSQVTSGSTYGFNNYTYNLAGNLTLQTLPSGKIIGTSIDGAGRIAGVYKQGGSYYAGAVETDATNRIQYAPQGASVQMKLGNGLWEQARFNKRLQMTQAGVGQSTDGVNSALTTTASNRLLLGNCFINTDPGCSAVSSSNNGNVLRHFIQAPALNLTQTFSYDELNRLALASESGGTAPWTQTTGTTGYDRYGNRAVTGAGDYIPAPALTPTSIAAYDPTTNRRNSAGYAYDLAGNMTSETSTRTMTFNAENLTATFNGGSGTTTYTYDGDGRRVKKVDNAGVTSVYVYDVPLGRCWRNTQVKLLLAADPIIS